MFYIHDIVQLTELKLVTEVIPKTGHNIIKKFIDNLINYKIGTI